MGKTCRTGYWNRLQFTEVIENWDILKKVLTKAAINARRVYTKDTFCPERVARAGEFQTQIRRIGQIEGLDKALVNTLLQKNLWDDVLQLKTSYSWFSDEIKFRLRTMCEEIRMSINTSNSDYIDGSLSEMDKELDIAAQFVVRAKKLAKESASIMDGFEELAESMVE